MKNLISALTIALILILVVCINCDAQIHYTFKQRPLQLPQLSPVSFYDSWTKSLTVQSGRTVIKLTPADVYYIEAKIGKSTPWINRFGKSQLNNVIVIKNNDLADLIFLILKQRS